MTVREMLDQKYRKLLKDMNRIAWSNLQARSIQEKKHPAELMYMALEITAYDIKENGGYNGELYQEILEMHHSKLMASNAHRQYSGHVTAYWLTAKGFRMLNKDHAIC